MYCDVVLANKNKELEDFAKKLGFSKLLFREAFGRLGIAESKDYETNRNLVESKKIKVLVNPQINSLKDSFHYRNGGLDQVICKVANKNNIAVAFTLDCLENPIIVGRIKQNIKLCRKYKVRMLFFSFAKNKYGLKGMQDLLSLLRVLGMSGKEANEALSF